MAAGGCHAAAAAGDPSSTSQFGFTFGSTSCRPNALQGLTFVLSSPNVARLESMRRAREVNELPEDIGCGTAASWPVAALALSPASLLFCLSRRSLPPLVAVGA